jgi:hypothetical protein
MLDKIDTYIRNISEENIEEYSDFYPFIDEDDIKLYKDIDKDLILGYSKGIFLKVDEKEKKENKNLSLIINKKSLFCKIIVSYILSLKIICDSVLYKPYSFILEILREFDEFDEFDNLGKISNSLKIKENDESIIKKLKKLEWDILIKCNFFNNEDVT